jgi:enoyl-CoA hydratase
MRLGTTPVQGPVRWDFRDGVLTVELNRVREMNILDVPTRKRILQVLRRHEDDDAVKCAVITARGSVFSAGADLNFLLGLRGKRAKSYAKFVRDFLDYLENYPKPTIGVVTGLAVGGGVELLMALDIIIATPEARFGQTEMKVGLIPGGGGTQRLPRSVGLRKAKEMVFTGGLISAQEAYEWGLVNRVVPRESVLLEVKKLCDRLKSMNQSNLRLVKQLMTKGSSMDLTSALRMESETYSAVLDSREAKTAIRAFLKEGSQKKKS